MSTIVVPGWLDHLRCDRRGLPVPYINLWGTEAEAKVTIQHDPWVDGPAVCMDDSKGSAPDSTRQHMGRQRECAVAGRCQVCRRDVPYSRRCLVVAALSVELQNVMGLGPMPLVAEPWLCLRCARFAVEHCPALIRKTRDEALTVVPVTNPKHYRIVVSEGWIEGPLEAESRRVQPAMWAKILLLRPRLAMG